MSEQHAMIVCPNPAYAGQTPRKLQAACHDRSPFLTIKCSCDAELHVHETQIANAPAYVEIATICKSCDTTIVFAAGEAHAAFKQMRDDGWID